MARVEEAEMWCEKKKKKEIGLAVSMVPFLLMFVLFLYKHNGFLSQP